MIGVERKVLRQPCLHEASYLPLVRKNEARKEKRGFGGNGINKDKRREKRG